MIKQIYSLIQYDESVKTMEAGANNIGLVPMQNGGVPAHRVPLDRVHKIFNEAKKRGVNSVAIMLTNDPEEMLQLAEEIQPDILHIAGDGYAATPAFAKRLKEVAPDTDLMQAVLIDNESAIDRAKHFAPFVDYLLLDSGLAPDTGIGASGQTHDWNIDAQIVKEVDIPVIEAGGLGPDNVADAIKKIKPYGVDSLTKTSIKYEGGNMEKDIDKVRLFCQRADEAAKEIGL
ncbi:phosphoribosylanthranilate isomerase [Lentilactobacillus hilgardii]|jgi:phosphoribosylanthranilate isomerase|uniref:N-(5'-phosphoribosyl)anthranilate isomerase n=2 Tax=Lentilactobacillus hilgardii TaxID=1588 RepID=A0A6P1E2B8_LENHI|nr:phosphoribosylanthranilate isomerase [Lentilactobacillus hilgardii]EEI71680.1 putative N-(5'phosphoribosyl)anthranilate isomerase [Lentilactobacillus hilgardii ATCC 27305]MCT3392895.1 phosphoribosylanthranilate isomerase [Lentilactobacillus hilgardii]QHB51456.1 phosphoribosylanthranilate isomerase [Lentilactobacillus hilgardii]RRG08888.1 MAG: phosphoribosylanthranilate isomerase [Lactobacillus sp.]